LGYAPRNATIAPAQETFMKHQKLELTWIGKDQRPRLEPRILLEDPARSYHAKQRETDNDLFDNRLIKGDNLLALKALEAEFTGKVKCVYMDPPFNTQQAFEHYDDGLEHSIWLSLMRDRLVLLHRLLYSEGTLFVHIDDNELAYLIVLLDEIFGRSNRLSIVTFKQGAATGHKAINPGVVTTTNYVLIYAKNKAAWKPRRLFTGRDRDKRYGQFLVNPQDHFSKWRLITLSAAFCEQMGKKMIELKKLLGPVLLESKLNDFVISYASQIIRTARPDYDAVSEAARNIIDESNNKPKAVLMLAREAHSDMYFKGGERLIFYREKLKEVDGVLVAGEPLTSLWDDLLSNNLHKEGGVDFPKSKKPEALIKRCIELSTNPGDLVLDSFAGSGTTGAVAHKMGRRWIMVELGEHCHTHIVPRLQKVIDGQDPGGVTQATNWKGGGGFRYYELAPTLLSTDRWGNLVINPEYDAAMLSAAMCQLEGFTYAPNEVLWWQQGRSSERDFIYVTTQTLSAEQLAALSDEVGAERSLLVCCAAYRGVTAAQAADRWPNLTLKKIPRTVKDRCEWGHDDYSLNVANLPMAQKPVVEVAAQDDLFGGDGA
jgi:adenine-specific DNA-methyltransferase